MDVTGVLILIPIVVFAAVPLFSEAWSISSLTGDERRDRLDAVHCRPATRSSRAATG